MTDQLNFLIQTDKVRRPRYLASKPIDLSESYRQLLYMFPRLTDGF